MTDTTRRVLVSEPGGPEVLRLVEEPLRVPRGDQVRIHVEVAGVAFGDVMRRRGVLAPRRPFTPGYDVVGIVDAVGPRAAEVEVGQRVGALLPKIGIGGYADHAFCPERLVVPIPDEVSPTKAVCLGMNYITALQLLERMAKVRPGERVLIHGAAGGVGTALLQVAQGRELRLYGTASKGKHDLLREYGAEPIDYRNQDFVEVIAQAEPDGLDVVLDPIGGQHLKRSYRCLKPRGRLIVYGVTGDLGKGTTGVLRGMLTYLGIKLRPDLRPTRLYAISVSTGCSKTRCRDDWSRLLASYQLGELDPIVGAELPLERVRDAHELLEAAAVRGKIVLQCGAGRS